MTQTVEGATTGDDDDSKSFHPLPLWLKTLILLVCPASVLAYGSYRAIPWFSTCPEAWSNCVDLGPRTVEEQNTVQQIFTMDEASGTYADCRSGDGTN